MSLRNRIAFFVKTMTVSDVLEKTNLKQSNLYRVRDGLNFGVDIIEEIINGYPNLNPSWLMYGNGEMWKDSNLVEDSTEMELKEDAVQYGKVQNTEGVLERIERRLNEQERDIEYIKRILQEINVTGHKI